MIEEVLDDDETLIYQKLTEQFLKMPKPRVIEEASQKVPLVDDRKTEVIVDVEPPTNLEEENHGDPRNIIQENGQSSQLLLQNLNNDHNKDKEKPTFSYIQIGWQTENCH